MQREAIHFGYLAADKPPAICCEEKESVEQVLDCLAKHRILSCPVKNSKGTIVGIISVQDIAAFLAWHFSKETLALPISSLCGSSVDGQTLWIFKAEEPLQQVFVPFSMGYHRILVKQQGGFRLISQSDVLAYMYRHHKLHLQPMSHRSLEELLLGKKDIATIPSNAPCLEGLKKITSSSVSAVAVVDPDTKQLVANLSASDLRGLHKQTQEWLNLTVLEFLAKQHDGKVPVPITVAPNASLEFAMKTLVENHVHRLWIVVGENIPVSVLSLTDVFDTLKKHEDGLL